MSNRTLNALQGLDNITLKAIAAFRYCDPALRERTLTWYWQWHNCQVVSCKWAPGRMITLRVILQNYQFSSEYSSRRHLHPTTGLQTTHSVLVHKHPHMQSNHGAMAAEGRLVQYPSLYLHHRWVLKAAHLVLCPFLIAPMASLWNHHSIITIPP